jgi:hypothetical protein
VTPVGDPEAVVEELVARVSGFGPLQRYLDDPTVEEFRSIPRSVQPSTECGLGKVRTLAS